MRLPVTSSEIGNERFRQASQSILGRIPGGAIAQSWSQS